MGGRAVIAEIVAVGTELLLGQIVNTNAAYLSRRLAELGVEVYFQSTVGDNPGRVAATFRQALARSDVVISTGGLGPTQDDLTKQAVADALGLRMVQDAAALKEIQAFFARRGIEMVASNARQAMIPEGARLIPNRVGTAPGVIVPAGEKAVILLPGPPSEMTPMFEEEVVPWIQARTKGHRTYLQSRLVRVIGIGESTVEDRISDLITHQTNPTLATYVNGSEVQIRLTAKTSTLDEARWLLDDMERRVAERLGRYIFGIDNVTLEQAVASRLQTLGWTLAVAESCTGGLIADAITNVPGASGFFLAGLVTYSNESKSALLGVDPELIARHGAVSPEVAVAMSRGVAEVTGAVAGIGVTGIAGPGGGSPDKPVGLVYVGLHLPREDRVQRFLFSGDRLDNKHRAMQAALGMLWLAMPEPAGEHGPS